MSMSDVPGAPLSASHPLMEHAGSSTASSSSATLHEEHQAGLLPLKAGEFGYRPPAIPPPAANPAAGVDIPIPRSPRRAPTTGTSTPFRPRVIPPTPTTASSMPNKHPERTLFSIPLTTLLQFLLFLVLLSCTVAAWAIAAMHFRPSEPSTTPTDSAQANAAAQSAMQTSGVVFLHVAFATATLLQLLLLDRTVYRMRAERHARLHPSDAEAQESGTGGGGGGGFIGRLAPWNRPALPTYAAALGVRGTGDVEDNAIAAPPPPAYGNTRGSTLLLSNLLRRASNASLAASLRRMGAQEGLDEEVVQDAARARRLEEALGGGREEAPRAGAAAAV